MICNSRAGGRIAVFSVRVSMPDTHVARDANFGGMPNSIVDEVCLFGVSAPEDGALTERQDEKR